MSVENGSTMECSAAEWCAYDYKLQQWIMGEPARELLLRQYVDTLNVLHSEEGAAYARALGYSKAVLIDHTLSHICELQRNPRK